MNPDAPLRLRVLKILHDLTGKPLQELAPVADEILAQGIYLEPAELTVERAGLTPAQEIRAALAVAAVGKTLGRPADAGETLALVIPLAQWAETGQHDDLEDACPEHCPNRAHEAERMRWQLIEANAKVDLCEARLAHVGWVLGLIGEGLPPGDERQLREALEWTPEPELGCTCAQVDVSTHGQPNLTVRGRRDPNCPIHPADDRTNEPGA